MGTMNFASGMSRLGRKVRVRHLTNLRVQTVRTGDLADYDSGQMAARAQAAFRPLTGKELELFRRIFALGSEDMRSFEPQLVGLTARRSCTCGCSSIQLQPRDSTPPGISAGERIIGEFSGVTVSGDSILLIVFQDDGRLSELEIAPCSDFECKEPEANIPKVESLDPI